eukprot:6198420-Pleurochrysis_carterae.AAC.5
MLHWLNRANRAGEESNRRMSGKTVPSGQQDTTIVNVVVYYVHDIVRRSFPIPHSDSNMQPYVDRCGDVSLRRPVNVIEQ